MIALYPGAFKPPHRGHFNVVKSLLDGSYNGAIYTKDDYKEKGAALMGGKPGEKPEIDKVVVFVGAGERNGISKAESMSMWKMYAKHLGNVEILDGQKNPMFAAKDYAQANPKEAFVAVTGIRGEQDFVDLRRVTTFKNAPNVQGLALASQPKDAVRATDFRKSILSGNLDTIIDFFPPELSKDQIMSILTDLKDKIVAEILSSNIDGFVEEYFTEENRYNKDGYDEGDIKLMGDYILPIDKMVVLQAEEDTYNRGLLVTNNKDKSYDVAYWADDKTKPYPIGIEIDGKEVSKDAKIIKFMFHPEMKEEVKQTKPELKDHITSLTEYMLDKGMNIQPLPEVKVRYDEDNAKDFFGKTAYYDPNSKEIVLYATDRHPKDICRSYTHEMIHHIQNLEGRLTDIKTSDTTADEGLLKLEQEAYLLGNITFRNWEDGIKNNFDTVKETITEGKYDAITTYLTNKSIEAVKMALRKKLHHYKEGHFGDPKSTDAQVALKNAADEVYPILIMDIPDDVDKKFQKETDLEFDYDLKVIFAKGINSIMRNGGAYKGGETKGGWVQPKVELEFVLDPYNFPRDFEELSAQITDVLRHEIEHLTQAGGNERGKTFDKDAQFRGEFGTEEEMRFRTKIRDGIVKNGFKYLTLPSEIDANIQGLYLTAKKAKRPFVDVVDQYLYQFTDQYNDKGEPFLTKQEVEDVKRVWGLRLKSLGIKQKL